MPKSEGFLIVDSRVADIIASHLSVVSESARFMYVANRNLDIEVTIFMLSDIKDNVDYTALYKEVKKLIKI